MSLQLTLDDVREILRLLDESPYDELTLETERFKLELRRTANGGWTQETRTAGASQAAAITSPPPARESAVPDPGDGGTAICAALPGTFYRAPKPGAEPFVAVGASVADDTVVAIIETMKLMNPVTAECSGTVTEICVENGQMVQAGDVLMRVGQDGT